MATQNLLTAAVMCAVLISATVAHAADTHSSWNGGTGSAISSLNSLTGIIWHVVELSGHPLGTSLQGERPFILFDAANQQVSGYTGCNRFFGGYEIDGTALKFGLIAATKRACPDLEEGMETEFFNVLAATKSWRIVEGCLQLLGDGLVLARFQKAPAP